jgi:hypothetical protein
LRSRCALYNAILMLPRRFASGITLGEDYWSETRAEAL